MPDSPLSPSSGSSGQIGDPGGLFGKMIEPLRPPVKVMSQRQARDRLQGPDDFLCWDLIIPVQKLDQSVCAQHVSRSAHISNRLNPLQLIRSAILDNGDHLLLKSMTDVRWRRSMRAGSTTQDPRPPSFEHHLEPVAKMALEDFLDRSFRGRLPEESPQSFPPLL